MTSIGMTEMAEMLELTHTGESVTETRIHPDVVTTEKIMSTWTEIHQDVLGIILTIMTMVTHHGDLVFRKKPGSLHQDIMEGRRIREDM